MTTFKESKLVKTNNIMTNIDTAIKDLNQDEAYVGIHEANAIKHVANKGDKN